MASWAKELAIDVETYSSVEIDSGVYAYTEADDFEIILIAYSFDGAPPKSFMPGRFASRAGVLSGRDIDGEQQELPFMDFSPQLSGDEDEFLEALKDPAIIKTAYNASFERTTLAKEYGLKCNPDEWRCTAVLASTLGLPRSLAGAGEAMGLSEDQKKLRTGKALIQYFCKPCKPSSKNGGRTRNLPRHDPEKWKLFCTYNLQDVITEQAIRSQLKKYSPIESEQRLWSIDQIISDRGIRIDVPMVEGIVGYDTERQQDLIKEAREITGLCNPNSVSQLKQWFTSHGAAALGNDMSKAAVAWALSQNYSPDVLRMLKIRKALGKTSTKKYTAMLDSVCPDGRVRGMLQFYGANRTGRWCLTGDHEVLTPEGWIRLDAWVGGRIACWTPAGELVSFQKAEALRFDYKGLMYHYHDKRIDQISTPDHKMYIKRRYDGPWQPMTIEDMQSCRPTIPFTGRRPIISGMDHNQLRILIMTQADGHYTGGGDIRYHFAKDRKVERCKHLLRRSGVPFTAGKPEATGARTITVPSRVAPLWLRQFRDKTFGWWLLDENPDVVFEELENWDGYRAGPNSMQYTTCNKQNADIIQALAHISGRCAKLKVKSRTDEHPSWNDAYILDIWLTPGNAHEIRSKAEKLPFCGKVYCASTPTGYFLVRRGGRVWVTGNSGKIVQLQNLPQNHIEDLDLAHDLVKSGAFDDLELLYGEPAQVFSELIRTAFIPSEGNRFVVTDFSAIEARVIAWLAGEDWRLDVFKQGGDIYCASASKMFHVPVEKHGINGHLRQRGKVAELALGYGGGVGAMKTMDTTHTIPEEEMQPIVDQWRAASPKIVQLWRIFDRAAKTAIRESRTVKCKHGIAFYYRDRILFVRLPSGRAIAYWGAEVDDETGELRYYGVGQESHAWCLLKTYGGKLTENIVQATARDCLAVKLVEATDKGYEVVAHVHDEMIIDVPKADADAAKTIDAMMAETISWAPELPLRGGTYECPYYQKD